MLLRSYVLAASALLTRVSSSPVAPRAPSGSKPVIAQMFEWTWDSIAAECTNFIGPAGYGFVQASPAQEHVAGSQWWTDYQPVSYILTSKRGNEAQYKNMIDTCATAGVGIIADTLFNHMAGQDSGTGTAGSSFTKYNYPGIYSNNDFHHCGLEPNDQIVNWNNEQEVWTCELSGLADLATDTTYVQQTLAGYANHLLSLGVKGFRLDAAKDIDPANIRAILNLLSTQNYYVTQEVIYGDGQPVTPALYTGNGDVQEFRYTSALLSAFSGGGISSLENLDNRGWVAGSSANVFVANHDSERTSGESLNANSPSNTYTLAMVFSLAHPYGTPTILSSYQGFTNTDAGSPNGGVGTCSGNTGTNGWYCQHRWLPVSGMVGFRNNVGSAALNNWVSPQSQQIAFGRGALGFVAINNADSAWTATFSTSLPVGSYCDVIHGIQSATNVCSGPSYTVSSTGTFTVTVAARDAAALHTGSKGVGTGTGGGSGSGSGTVTVNFAETATTTFGENIFLVGSIAELKSWNTASAIALSSASYPVWTVTVTLPASTAFEYKFIRKETDGTINWESGNNRADTTPASGSQTLTTSWQ
ncbi:carbohydrate-binding module family 20 protein [Peniophora sp. CONT]|nr:carbohydrate-binding module family 20 protein [Peniophora sp. CONT]